MADLIPQPFIDDLLDRVDIVDVVDRRVKLKKSGKNYSACCPFHDEKTPSFTVSPDKQFYYCFGCGASGNAIGFVIDYDRLGFPDAVEHIAKLCGLEVPRTSWETSPIERERKDIYALLEKADRYYRQQLRLHPNRQTAVSYLKSRGLSGEIARDFGIGYAPPGWDNLDRELGQNPRLLVESGMLIVREDDQKRYDRFRHRIMFPIRDSRGRVIGFGGRVLGDDKPKYLNSPETPVFHKGQELYGLFEARKAHRQLPRLLIVEGYMDVVALAQYGIRYGVATLGTACGEDHLKRAFRHTAEIVFCFDGDNAGRTAAHRALDSALSAMEDGRQVKFLFLPEGEDPDTLVRQIGADKFIRKIDLAIPLEDFLFDAVAEGIDTQSMEGRARMSKLAAPLLDKLPKGVYRELMFNNLARRTGLSVDTLLELVNETLKEQALNEHPQAPQSAVNKSAVSKSATDNGKKDGFQGARHPSEQHLPTEDIETPPFDYPEVTSATENDQTPVRRAAQASGSGTRQIKLPPQKLIAALLLHHPELAQKVEDPKALLALQNTDIELFVALLELLQQRPNYTISRILGYWRATYGAKATDELAAVAASQLLLSAKQLSPYDPEREFEDILDRIRHSINEQNCALILEKLKSKALNEFSDEEKQLYKKAIAYKSTNKHNPPT